MNKKERNFKPFAQFANLEWFANHQWVELPSLHTFS